MSDTNVVVASFAAERAALLERNRISTQIGAEMAVAFMAIART
jgi:hypothetical protein